MPWRPWSPDGGAVDIPLPAVIGHRGAAARAPENTLEGIAAAARLGVAWVELDVMLTADEVPVLIHDETVDRTTDGRGAVPSLRYDQLRGLDAGGGARIPTLDQAIDLLVRLPMSVNLEIKPAAGHDRRTAEVVVATLRERWPATGPSLLISSFSRAALAVAADLAPSLPRGLLAGALPRDWAAALTDLGCTTLHLWHRRVSRTELAMLVERGVPTLLYTVNDVARARTLLAAGAVAVFSDVPDSILAGLDQ